MADETKTQIPKPTRQRGPMGRMGGMRRGEKAKDFKGTMRQLLGYIGQHKIAVFAAVAFAVCSVIFNIVGPKVLGQVTTKLFEGLVAKVNGTGDVDFGWIAKTLGLLLCLHRDRRLSFRGRDRLHPRLAHVLRAGCGVHLLRFLATDL